MVTTKWLLGLVLIGAVLFVAMVPNPVAKSPSAASQRQQEGKRVYTNDDFPAGTPVTASGDGPQAVAGEPGEKVAPFVPTPMEIVDKMLELAEVKPSDTVYDLGSGDGRIVLRAAERFGAKAVGVEIDHGLVRESLDKAAEMKLDKLVTIIEGDLFKTDLKPATVVTIYLLLSTNDRLRPILERDLKPGTRVVAHDIRIPGWEPSLEEEVTVGGGVHYVYLYHIPNAFRKPATR
jgi:SAM-dependent methyltransferase